MLDCLFSNLEKLADADYVSSFYTKFKQQILDEPSIDAAGRFDLVTLFGSESDDLAQERLVGLAVYFLRLYFINNYSGPRTETCDILKLLNETDQIVFNRIDQIVRTKLIYQFEHIHPTSTYPILIYIAKLILIDSTFLDSTIDTNSIFKNAPTNISNGHFGHKLINYLRLLCLNMLFQQYTCSLSSFYHLYQQVLTNTQNRLQQLVTNASTDQHSTDSSGPDIRDETHLAIFLLAQAYFNFRDFDKIDALMLAYQSAFNFKYELTGVLGKRMKYQQNLIAQLVLSVESDQTESSNSGQPSNSSTLTLPEDVSISEESALLKNVMLDTDKFGSTNLNQYQQLFVLMLFKYHYFIMPKDELLDQVLRSYLEVVNKNPQNWLISNIVLRWRSFIEFNSVKRMERALLQYENLIKEFDDKEIQDFKRLSLWFISDSEPFWKVKQSYAETLIRIGCIKSALDIYEYLQDINGSIKCYMSLGRHESAESSIRKLLVDSPNNVNLLCLLGDVTEDIKYYTQAIQVSNSQSSRPFKCLGLHYFKHKNFELCTSNLEKTLEINSLQDGLWFTLGCVYMKLNQLTKAARCFIYSSRQEPDNFECWNNLAACYMNSGKYQLAYRAIKEAIKYNFNNVKVWANFLYLCLEIQCYQDAIYACNTLLELSGYGVSMLSDSIISEIVFAYHYSEEKPLQYGYQRAKMYQDVVSLMKSIVQKNNVSWQYWKLFSTLYSSKDESKTSSNENIRAADSIPALGDQLDANEYSPDDNLIEANKCLTNAIRELFFKNKIWVNEQNLHTHIVDIFIEIKENCLLLKQAAHYQSYAVITASQLLLNSAISTIKSFFEDIDPLKQPLFLSLIQKLEQIKID